MARAIAPAAIPPVPDAAQGWRRSLRKGAMFHAHSLGTPICGARLYLERNASRAPEGLADMQYWGVCPRCFRKAMTNAE